MVPQIRLPVVVSRMLVRIPWVPRPQVRLVRGASE